MSPSNTPASPGHDEDAVEDTLEALRARLLTQRATQKASFARHKQTTSLCIETARKSTIYIDPAILQAKLDEDEDEAKTAD